jgi:hypothetical protein
LNILRYKSTKIIFSITLWQWFSPSTHTAHHLLDIVAWGVQCKIWYSIRQTLSEKFKTKTIKGMFPCAGWIVKWVAAGGSKSMFGRDNPARTRVLMNHRRLSFAREQSEPSLRPDHSMSARSYAGFPTVSN